MEKIPGHPARLQAYRVDFRKLNTEVLRELPFGVFGVPFTPTVDQPFCSLNGKYPMVSSLLPI